jgi:hypothetical protein
MQLLEIAATDALDAFDTDKPFSERLWDSLDISILSLHRRIDATPHGSELMGVNDEIASDIEERWCDCMIDTITAGISDAKSRGEVVVSPLGVDARDVASIVMQSMEGLKACYLRGKPIDDDVRKMVTFVSNALTVQKA